jgi:hypothetical protein
MTMTRNLIAAAIAALLAGAGSGVAQPSDGNAAAVRQNSTHSGNTRLTITAPRIFLQNWHRA